jgi:hypothetical protein
MSERRERNLDDVLDDAVEQLANLVTDLNVLGPTRASFRYGSTAIVLSATEIDDHTPAIVLDACVATDVPASPGLYEWLIEVSAGFVFGRWHCDLPPGEAARVELSLCHTPVAQQADRPALRATVAAFGAQANSVDELVVNRFGGRRHRDEVTCRMRNRRTG